MTTFKTTRRATLKLLATGAGALAMPNIITSARAQSKVVNVTTYDKFVPQSFIDQFQKDTGIEVRVRLTDDQGKQYNLLSAEGENPSTDIVTVTSHRVPQFLDSNLLAPIDTARLKNFGRLASAYKGAKQLDIRGGIYGIPLLVGFSVLARNTDYTKASEDWGLTFDDDYKALTSYIISDFLGITMLHQGNDGDYATYEGKADVAQAATDQARDYLIKNKDKVRKFYDSGSEVQQMFVNEDIYVAHAWSGPSAKLIMDGHPIEITVPKEGTYGFLYAFNVVNNAPNTDAAYTFLDAILSSPEIGASMTRQSGFASTFDGVDKILNDRERAALALPQDQMERVKFYSSINRAMKNEMTDRAVAEIKAA